METTAKYKIPIASIGIGAAGANIADAFVSLDVRDAFILNSSEEDLQSARLVEPDCRIKFGSINGAAKNRAVAFEAIKKEYDVFLKNLENTILRPGSAPKICFISAGAGGGTGSGTIAVITKMLTRKYPNTIFVPIIALPSEYEKPIAQANAIGCMKELLEGSYPIVVIDNSKVRFAEGTTIMQKYDTLNRVTVSNIIRMVSTSKVSRYGNIDVEDRLSMFMDPGILVIGSAIIDPTEDNPLLSGVRRAVDDTPMSADVGSSVSKAMVQFECDEALYTEKGIANSQGYFKNVYGVFEGYYSPEISSEPPSEGKTKTINRVLVAYSGAKFSEKWIQERQALVDSIQVNDRNTLDTSILRGNRGLNSAWASQSKQPVSAVADDFGDLFAAKVEN